MRASTAEAERGIDRGSRPMTNEPNREPTNVSPARATGSSPIGLGRGPLPEPGAGGAQAQQPAPEPAPAGRSALRGGISNLRFVLAMGVAFLADTIGLPFGEFGIFVFDVFVGLLLALCLRGFRPEIIIACLIEAIPGIGMFPSWSLAVPAIWARMKLLRGAGDRPANEPPRRV
jgi:hypothetical protein